MAKPTKTKESENFPFVQIDDKIDEALLQARRIFISDAVDNESAQDIIRKLWYLEIQDPGKPILLVINSPGGSIDSGFAIWDQIQMISSPVSTLVSGLAASMGSILSLAGPKNRRFVTPNSRIMIHQPLLSGVIQGQATDLDIQAKELVKNRDRIIQIYVDATGKKPDIIEKAVDRDSWFSAEEALKYGLINKIVTKFDDIPK